MSRKKVPSRSASSALKQPKAEPTFFTSPWLPYLVTAIYLFLGAIGMYKHEMWRDEHQAWLVARDAGSYIQLFENMRYEGNPMLWHTLLWILNFFTENPAAMQVLHLCIAAGFIFILNKYAPFPKWICLLLTLNYFLFYEYAIISRGYGLGVLLAFVICALFGKREKYFFLIGLLLFLLANTSVYGVLIAGAITILFICHHFWEKQISLMKLGLICVMAAAGAILSMYQIWPEPDNSFPVIYAPEQFDDKRFSFCAWKLVSTYFAFPDISRMDYWGSSILISDNYVEKGFVPFIALLAFALLFIRKPAVLLLYSLGTIGLIYFYYYTLLTHARYLGHFLILLLVCMWLSAYFRERIFRTFGGGEIVRRWVLPVMVVFSAAGGLAAWFKDWSVPFSGSVEAAHFIREQKLEDATIVGATDFVISCLPSLLQTKAAYYPERHEWGSFVKWDSKRADKIDFNRMISATDSFLSIGKKPVLLILSAPPQKQTDHGPRLLENDFLSPTVKVTLLKAVTRTVVKDEQYYIYKAEKVQQ